MNTFLAICLCMAIGRDRRSAPGDRGRRRPGAPEYAAQFRDWAGQWRAAAEKAGAGWTLIGEDGAGGDDRERLHAALAEEASAGAEAGAEAEGGREPLWIVLIGHGTFDGREAKFNLRGPDVSDRELAGWLAPIKGPVAIIDCTSSSSPFLNQLSGDGPRGRHRDPERPRAELRPVRPVHRRGDRRPRRRPRQGRAGLAPRGLPDRRQPGRGVLPHPLATGHRARPDRRQRRPARHARRLVPGGPRHPSGEGRRPARRHPGPSAPPDPQRLASARSRPRPAVAATRSSSPSPPSGTRRPGSAPRTTTAGSRPLMVELARLYREMPGDSQEGGKEGKIGR